MRENSMAPSAMMFSLRKNFSEWLSKSKTDASTPSRVHSKRGISPRTTRLKESPSLLFRLWSSVGHGHARPMSEEEIPLMARVDGEILVPEAGSHPLQPYYTQASKVKKRRGSLLHGAAVLKFWGIIEEDVVILETNGDDQKGCMEGDGEAIDGGPGAEMVAGRRWEGDKFRDCGKSVDPKIGLGEITIDEFPVLEGEDCPRILRRVGCKLLGPNGKGRRAVSWTNSIQEYAGGLGSVRHSGERPVSDCFRSLTTSIPVIDENAPTAPSNGSPGVRRIPTLRPLSSRTGFGQRPQFEQDQRNLINDWETAMRLMEEFSNVERARRRMQRRRVLGVKSQNVQKGEDAGRSPLSVGPDWKPGADRSADRGGDSDCDSFLSDDGEESGTESSEGEEYR